MLFDILITLIVNTLILLSISTIRSLFPYNDRLSTKNKTYLLGLYVGLTGIAIMTIPFDFNNGVFFDTRTILLSSSGIFLGIIPTLIGMIPMIVYRVILGGVGTVSGVLEILISATMGILFRYYYKKYKKTQKYKLKDLVILTYIIQILVFSLFFLLSKEIRQELIPKMWYMFVFLYPVASVLVYIFHIKQENTELQKERIHYSEKQYRALFELSHVVLLVLDTDGRIVDANKTALDFYGWSYKQITSMSIHEINTLTKDEIDKEIAECVKNNKTYFNFKHRVASGDIIDVEIFSGPIMINNQERLLSTVIDATNKIQYQNMLIKQTNDLEYTSYHDHLTGLHNRLFFEESLKSLNESKSMPLTIILVDVNDLKKVNDTFSHLVGDELIKEIATILKKAMRKDDIIVRWGGDEFVILLPNTDKKIAEKAVRRIERFCQKSLFEQLTPSIAIGYDTKTIVTDDLYDSLQRAEKRMYKDKASKKKNINGYGL